MFDFQYYAPTRVVFGRGVEARTGSLLKELGAKRVLLHYGGGSAVKSGLLSRVAASLDEAGIAHTQLGGVVPNPRLSKVREGAKLAQEFGADLILAVGGGSVIDSSKAIGYAVAEPDRDVWEIYDRKRTPKACLPVACVLTIAAAGSEMSNSSVITNEDTREKRGYRNDLCRVKLALMDPELTTTLPPYQTAAGCTDILMHTLERYFTQGGNMELTDEIAEGLMRTVMKNALILRDDPANYDARAEVMWASSLSHNDLTGLGANGMDFVSHGMEHELGGMFDVTHGAGLSAVWPSWARYVYRDCLPRFVKFARTVMGVEGTSDEDTALKGIAALEDFFRSIHMPVTLKELGVEPTEEQILAMAASCARGAGGKKGTAKLLYEADMAEIYRMAR
ncbi:MAG: iron-containing alcohol dehydrogenase [Oscillospiraceae bacterium]|nr:iron-containing alcohol dehydrogenase [Oscillospiraceae bacterium]MCI9308865.1 iron-containing alcohol dehydrogenase [Oscillospiraceae bacterium]MCI9548870.1 iron-containing alcohol dehydrogenase [Oscillospiraceae bacterium]